MNVKAAVIFAVCLMLPAGCTTSGPSSSSSQKDQEAAARDSQTGDHQQETGSSDGSATGQEADEGVNVIPLRHASLLLEANDAVVAVDPTTKALEAARGDVPAADAVVVTHAHPDHLDASAIAKVRKAGAPVVAPQSVVDKAGNALPNPTVLDNGSVEDLGGLDVTVRAVPMYNQKRKRDNGEFYHPKGRGNGYILSFDAQRVYVSGDTECTPEMKRLDDIDIAFISMNLPYTMPPKEAAPCINAFEPGVVYPYHYRGQDPSVLRDMISDDIELKIADWYPGQPD